MVNVNIRFAPKSCEIEAAGDVKCFSDVAAARKVSDDAAVGFALLCKGGRLLKDGEFRFQSSHPITASICAYTGQFQQSGCAYQMAVFVEKTDDGAGRLKAVQLFPDQVVSRYTDVYVTDPDLLEQTGFMASVRQFVAKP